MVTRFLRPSFLTAALALCLFGAVVGLKWATFDRFGSAMPDWDQWDAEALNLLGPWYGHDHVVQHILEPHNEHRVVLTKVQNLTLTLLNGQWDARLEAVTNAMLHGLVAVALWLLARRRLPAFTHAPVWLLAVVLFGFPLAWQNVLGGFHSQQYWLVALSLAAIVTLPFARPWSGAWWAAVAAALLALLTMGSGLLAGATVLAVVVFRWLRRETTLREAWPTLAVCAVAVAIGLLTRVEVYYHSHMKVKTLHDFIFSMLHSLQWPMANDRTNGLAALFWLPWIAATWRVIRERDAASRTGQVIVALGGWVLLQIVATAYARGAGADFPASRYMDTLTFGAMVNGLSLAWLLAPARRGGRMAFGVIATAWVITLGFGIKELVTQNIRDDMPAAKRYYVKSEAHMRGYLATDDPAQLAFPDIPYPSAGGIIDRLSLPGIRALMPAVLRAPLPVQVASPGPFAENRANQLTAATAPRIGTSPLAPALASLPTWGSYDAQLGVAATGEWRSAPLTSPLGAYLKFETSGPLGESPATLRLELRDAATNELLTTVEPSKVPGDTWRAAYVSAPSKPFVIVAVDNDPARWLAFSAPVEMGRLSYWAWRATQRGLLLAELSLFAAFTLGLLVITPRRLVAAALKSISRPIPLLPAPPSSASPAPVATAPARVRVSLPPFPLPKVSFPRTGFGPPTVLRPRTKTALVVFLFFTIWGAKLVAIDHYGSDLPYWDQWAKEGDYLLTPWFEHHELWKNLFLPHNEHRIAPTLAMNLALVTGGGQWDARVQCVASAALHAAIAAGLFLWALRRFSTGWALAVGLVLIAATAPPIAWENVLGGFQSQFYFLAGFSLLALAGLITAPALSRRWWGGALCGLLALVSMGSGLLIAGPLLVIAVHRLVAPPSSRCGTLLTLAATVFLGGLGLILRTPAPWHDTIHAHSVSQFIVYGARCLAWPLPHAPWLAPLLWAPWLVLLTLRVKQWRAAPTTAMLITDFLLAAGGWVLLQVAAVTFSRAGGGDLPASRYGDIAALGLMISFLSLAHLATSLSLSRRWLFPTWGIGHLALVATCLTLATRAAIAGPLPAKKAESDRSERSVQAFVLTDDYETFAKAPLPFPLPDWLARILRRPDIRAVLPASVRAPIKTDAFSATPTPPAPPLWERRTRSQVTAGDWRMPILSTGKFGWWKIETTGPAFSSPLSPAPLRLVTSTSVVTVAASRAPRPAEWRAAYIPAPTEPAALVAQTPDAAQWLAFTEPVEVSALSYRTWQLAHQGWWVLGVGSIGFLAVAGYAMRRRLIFSRTC